MPKSSAQFDQQHAALTSGAGVVDFSHRTQVEFTGADRGKYLHNLCTNAVRDRPIGSGCEAFVLNVKGHVVGHVFMFVCPESIVLETVPDQAETLIAHFERYLIREDVQIRDRTNEWFELLLAGAKSADVLGKLEVTIPQNRLDHCAAKIGGSGVWIRRVDLTGPTDFLIAGPKDSVVAVQQALVAAGAEVSSEEAFESARIEYGTPLFGRDIKIDNLPQEVDRNEQAISFTKGCYLGQETVARIDALGHVNRLLRRIKFSGNSIPQAGSEVHPLGDEKPVGQITSEAWSPRYSAPLALAIMRRGHHEPGTQLESAYGTVVVF